MSAVKTIEEFSEAMIRQGDHYFGQLRLMIS
jgi:hypothetical protein